MDKIINDNNAGTDGANDIDTDVKNNDVEMTTDAENADGLQTETNHTKTIISTLPAAEMTETEKKQSGNCSGAGSKS